MADLCLTLNGLWELQASALSAPDTMSQQVHYSDKQGNIGHAREIHDLAVGQVKILLRFFCEQASDKLDPDTHTQLSRATMRTLG